MKKFLLWMSLVCAVMTLTCTAALAAGTITTTVASGFQDSVVMAPVGSDKVQVTLRNVESDSQYLILVLSENTSTPREDNIVYIDQESSSNEIVFTVYPNTLTPGQTYYINISSNASGDYASLTQIGTFVYTEGGDSFTLGDPNNDGAVNIEDAAFVVDYVVQNITDAEVSAAAKTAADVTKDNVINIEDAARIVDYIVQNITAF